MAQITSFDFASPSVTGSINNTNHTIALTVPYGTNVTSLTPTIAVSTGATVSPTSGTAQDFTNPVTYTVTAQDTVTTQTYTVTVTVAANTSTLIRGGGGLNIVTPWSLEYQTPQPQNLNSSKAPTQTTQNTLTQEQKFVMIAQIKQQLISLIIQLIQLLTSQIDQMNKSA